MKEYSFDTFSIYISFSELVSLYWYSSTSVTRTLMARLPRLFRTSLFIPEEKIYWLQIWDDLGWFSFFILKMVYYVFSLQSPRWGDSYENTQYTSVTRTLMACLPRLFRTPPLVPRKNIHWLQIWDNLGWFSFFIFKMVYYVYSLQSPRWGDSNENTQYTIMLKKIENISLSYLRYDENSLAGNSPVSN